MKGLLLHHFFLVTLLAACSSSATKFNSRNSGTRDASGVQVQVAENAVYMPAPTVPQQQPATGGGNQETSQGASARSPTPPNVVVSNPTPPTSTPASTSAAPPVVERNVTNIRYAGYVPQPQLASLPGHLYVEGASSSPMMPFPGFMGTIALSVCDWNSDGFTDAVYGAGPGGGPHVKVYYRTPSGLLTQAAEKFVAQCDAKFCYTGGITALECRGNGVIRVTFGNEVVQDHQI